MAGAIINQFSMNTYSKKQCINSIFSFELNFLSLISDNGEYNKLPIYGINILHIIIITNLIKISTAHYLLFLIKSNINKIQIIVIENTIKILLFHQLLYPLEYKL